MSFMGLYIGKKYGSHKIWEVVCAFIGLKKEYIPYKS